MRGRDPQTGDDVPERRDEQFALLKDAQKQVLNLASWHHFLGALALAGFRGEKMISSPATVIYTYVLYLIGVCDYGLDRGAVRQAVAEFYFMAALTGRYTNSPESRVEADLSKLRGLADGKTYLEKLREISATTLTSDYWSITLPTQLATSAARSPSLFAYQAALIKLDANALFSPAKLAVMIDPSIKGSKAALEQHHLFPRAYLESIGITDFKQINQIANFAPVEWPDNIKIGKQNPADYVAPLDATLSASNRDRMYGHHALPPVWWELPYEQFLVQRRVRMAAVVQEAWQTLTGATKDNQTDAISITDLIKGGETGGVEFKSTLRVNLHTGQPDEKIQLSALKTVAGFLNARGGTLLIGVNDDGEALGLEADKFPNEDKMGLHLVNLIRERMGEVFLPYVHAHFDDQQDQRVLLIRCERGPKPAFLKDGANQRFFVRGGNSTAELSGTSITDYVKQRFP